MVPERAAAVAIFFSILFVCLFFLVGWRREKEKSWDMTERQRSVDNGEGGGNIEWSEVASYPICHVATFCGRVYLFIITSGFIGDCGCHEPLLPDEPTFLFVFLAFRFRDERIFFLILFESPYHIFT